jgi:hypothetical protein
MPPLFRPRRPLLRGAMLDALTQEEFQTAKQRLLAGA